MRVVVVGGGIAGLTCGWTLRAGTAGDPTSRDDLEVVVLESDDRVGGKLETAELAGRRVDVGAEAYLARRPEADRLARRVGLGDDLVEPQQLGAHLWLGDRLVRIPPRTVFGVPTDAASVAGVLPPAALARVVAEPLTPREPLLADASVADVLVPRFGREVVDVLVEPLLGGVYAGSVDRLGVRATTPMIAAAAREPGPLTPHLRVHQRRGASATEPVFRTIVGGTARLAEALAADLDVRTGVAAVALEPGPAGRGWTVDTTDGRLDADHVVVTTAAQPAAELLSPHAPVSARALRSVPYATALVIATAWPAERARLPAGSGMLVPRSEGRLVKAATWSSSKWGHLADGEVVFVRFSVGRVDDRRGLELDDRLLAELVLDEGREALGLEGEPVDVLVRRWVDGLPQYEVGHAERVGAVRQGLPAGLHVAGALYDGVGIAPTIASAERVAATIRALG